MSEIVDVKIGQSFTPDEWFAARDRLEHAVPMLASYIIAGNGGNGKLRAAEFVADVKMALAAIDFVARFASENCRYIITKCPAKAPPED